MSVSFSCRATAYFFCLSVYFSSVFANQTTNSYSIVATNSITSSQDSLSLCRISEENTSTECQEIHTFLSDGRPVSLNNPIALAANEKNFFIANYGMVGSRLGTSFLLKCELPQFGNPNVTCASILALFSSDHITGMHVIGQKLFFVRSFSTPSTSLETGKQHFLNSNYLNACHIPLETEENQRIHECGSSVALSLDGKIHVQDSYNTSMEIIAAGDFLSVSDAISQVTYQCSVPSVDNNLTACEGLPYKKPSSPLSISLNPMTLKIGKK